MGQTKIVRFSCHFSRQNKPVLRHKQKEAAFRGRDIEIYHVLAYGNAAFVLCFSFEQTELLFGERTVFSGGEVRVKRESSYAVAAQEDYPAIHGFKHTLDFVLFALADSYFSGESGSVGIFHIAVTASG